MSTGQSDPILRLSRTARDDLAHLASHRTKLSEITDAISRLPPGIGLSDAARIVAEAAEMPPQESVRVLGTIQNLQRLKIRLREDAAQLLKTITASLESQTSEDWKKKNLGAWKEALDAVSQLLSAVQEDHPLAVIRKADQLGGEHQNTFMDARILTDLRPVFGSASDRIHQSLVIQTLLVDYYDGSEPRRIAVAMDAHDIAQLRRLCERAEAKACALKAALDELPWPTVILGDEKGS